MTPKEKQELVDSYNRWYHEFDFGDGVKCTPYTSHPEIWKNIEKLFTEVDFKNKSVLEIGCWDGFWSFKAEKLGATRVLATDLASQRWGSKKGFEIAKDLLNSNVEYNGNLSIFDVDKLSEKFDVILCLGVYYHLQHMNYCFAQLRKAVKDEGILLIEGATINDLERSYMEFYYENNDKSNPMNADSSNWSHPTRKCLIDMIKSCYFEVIEEQFPQSEGPIGRSLIIAKAVRRVDDNHTFRPSHWLDQFDPRFQG